jgi:hypothetical protein
MSKSTKSNTGYYVRDSKTGGFAVERITPNGPATTSLATVHLPGGKTVKSIDRDLFERAVRAAAKK